jgi:hypothetical protein
MHELIVSPKMRPYFRQIDASIVRAQVDVEGRSKRSRLPPGLYDSAPHVMVLHGTEAVDPVHATIDFVVFDHRKQPASLSNFEC